MAASIREGGRHSPATLQPREQALQDAAFDERLVSFADEGTPLFATWADWSQAKRALDAAIMDRRATAAAAPPIAIL